MMPTFRLRHPSLEELVRDVEFFDADAIIATGQRTGDAASTDYLRQIRTATTLPLLVGSGCTERNIAEILSVVDGVIVTSSLNVGGVWWNLVDETQGAHLHAGSPLGSLQAVHRGKSVGSQLTSAPLRGRHLRV